MCLQSSINDMAKAFTLNLRKLKKFVRQVKRKPLPNTTSQKWGDDIADQTVKRFRTNGNGSWTANKRSTTRRKGNNRPLIDSGTLMRAAQIGASGNLYKRFNDKIQYGFFGGIHGHRTIGQLAAIHQFGIGVSKREIIVMPNKRIGKKMTKQYLKDIDKLGQRIGGRA